MRLQWSWFQIILDVLIDLKRCINNVCHHVGNIRGESTNSEMPLKNGLEDGFHGVIIEVSKGNNIEMSLESWSNERFTTTWGSHSSNNHSVNNVSEWMLVIFSVIPSTLILELSKNFNWRLRLKEDFRHVKIINKDDTLHSKSWSKVVFSSLIKFHVNNVLNLIAMSLSRETNLNNQPFLSWKFLEENVLNISGLSCTCWSNKKRWNWVHDEKLLHEAVSDSIRGCYDQFIWNGTLWEVINFILIGLIHPVLPVIGFWHVDVIINSTSIEASW